MKRISIESELAKIGIRSEPAKLEIQNNVRRFKTTKSEAKPSAETKRPTFKVNWQAVRDQTGLAGTVELSRQFRANAKQATGEAIANTNAMGEMVMNGSTVGQAVAQQTISTETENINIQSMPQSAPEIEWDVGSTKINWSPYELNIEWDDNYMPSISVAPHSVEIFMENYPSIKISVVDDGLFITQGRNVDQRA